MSSSVTSAASAVRRFGRRRLAGIASRVLRVSLAALLAAFLCVPTIPLTAGAGVPVGRISADTAAESLWLTDWPATTALDVLITQSADPEAPVVFNTQLVTDGTGQATVDLAAFGFDLQPGHYVVVTDGAITKQLLVFQLAFTSIDQGADTVQGTTDATLDVHVSTQLSGGATTDLYVTPSGGTFTADFSGQADVQPGSIVMAFAQDEDFDLTTIRTRIPPCLLEARPTRNTITLVEWPPSTEVEIVVDDDDDPAEVMHTYSLRTDTLGNAVTGTGFNIAGGQHIRVIGGGESRAMIVDPALAVTMVDAFEDTVVGMAGADTEVTVGVSGAVEEPLQTTSDGGGGWSVDFTATHPFADGDHGFAQTFDAGGNTTIVGWTARGHNLQANSDSNSMGVNNWEPATPITFTVLSGDSTVDTRYATTDGDGNVWIKTTFDIRPGMTVRAFDGIYTAEIALDPAFSVTGVDADNDTISGTAPAGATVRAFKSGVGGPAPEATADGSGVWTITMTSVGGLAPGSNGSVSIQDPQDDAQMLDWRVPRPMISVNSSHNNYNIVDFPTDALVTITVTGGGLSTPHVQQVTTNGNGGAAGNFAAGLDVIGGMTVLAEGPGGSPSKSLYLPTDLAVTSVDWQEDVVAGIAPNGAEVQVNVWAGGVQPITTTSDGTWSVDFTSAFDIRLGDGGGASITDGDGDRAMVAWVAARPTITVDPVSDNISVNGWPAYSDVRVSIDGPGPADWAQTVHVGDMGNGYRSTGSENYDITTGIVTATNDTDTKTLLIDGAFFVDHTDIAGNGVSGHASPGAEVTATFATMSGPKEAHATADWMGLWTAHFIDYDIMAGDNGNATIQDGDGDRVQMPWWAREPYVEVSSSGQVWVQDWSPRSTVTLISDLTPFPSGQTFAYVTTNDWGNGYVDVNPRTFPAGTYVHAIDNFGTKSLQLVGGLLVTDASALSETVTGQAPAESTVTVQCYTPMGPVEAADKSDGSGAWSATFTTIDLVAGMGGLAKLEPDEDGDRQVAPWGIANPFVSANLSGNGLELNDWPSDTVVNLTAYSSEGGEVLFSRTPQIDDSRSWQEYDIQEFTLSPGQFIEAIGGGFTKTLTVEDLSITAVDDAANTVSGTYGGGDATLGAWINNRDWIEISSVAGVWSVDWTDRGGIAAGDGGGVQKTDQDGDQTRVTWQLANPRIWASAQNDCVGLEGWTPGSNVHIAIFAPGDPSPTEPVWQYDAAIDDGGNFEGWDLGGFELDAGMLVVAGDGETTKDLRIAPLTSTGDKDTDTVSGTADEGAPVAVWLDNTEERYELTVDGSGTWSQQFGNDIVSGSGGCAEILDGEGDATRAWWYIQNPRIWGDPQNDAIGLEDWPGTTNVLVEVFAAGDPVPAEPLWSSEFPTDENGYCEAWGIEIDLEPGMLIRATFAEAVKELRVASLTAAGDKDTDTVSGTADPGAEVRTWIDGAEGDHTLTVDGSGTWSQYMDGGIDPGNSGAAEVGEGMGGDGDATRAWWTLPNPSIHADLFYDGIDAMDWPLGATVHVTIDNDDDPSNGEPLWEGSAVAEDWGWGWAGASFYELDGVDLVPGLFVTVTDGDTTKVLRIQPIDVTSVDPDTDVIAGTTFPNAAVTVWSEGENGWWLEGIEADGDGRWSAIVTGGDGIRPGDQGSASVSEPDGDWTSTFWSLVPAAIWVDAANDSFGGDGFELDTDVTFTFYNGPGAGGGVAGEITSAADRHGGVQVYDSGGFDIEPGQYVVASDGTNTTELAIVDLRITEVDLIAETVSGLAPAGAAVRVDVAGTLGWASRDTVADGEGLWSVDFSAGEYTMDIVWDAEVSASISDDEGDRNTNRSPADTEPPTTTSDARSTYSRAATIRLTSDDGPGIGVAETWYSLDGDPWTSGATVRAGLSGRHTLEFYSVDGFGNAETPTTVSFLIARGPLDIYEEKHPGVVYNGSWSSLTGATYAAEDLKVGNGPGTSFTVRFTGTAITWFAATGPAYGIAQVRLDGALVKTVDLFSRSTTSQKAVYAKTKLPYGPHTLTVGWTGLRNRGSAGTGINVDAIGLMGVITP